MLGEKLPEAVMRLGFEALPIETVELITINAVNHLIGIYRYGCVFEEGSVESEASALEFSEILRSLPEKLMGSMIVELVGIVVAMEAEINELKGTDGDVQ